MRITDLFILAIVSLYIIGVVYILYSDVSSRISNPGINPIERIDIEKVREELLNRVWNDLRVVYEVEGYIAINETVTIIDSTIEITATRNQTTQKYSVDFRGDPQITGIFKEIHNITGSLIVDSIEEIFIANNTRRIGEDILNGINVDIEMFQADIYRVTLYIEPGINIPLKIVITIVDEYREGEITLIVSSIRTFR